MTNISLSAKSIYSAANQITFSKTQEVKDFVGNGFLIEHKGKVYAVTAKHVLFETQKSGIKSVDIKGYFKNWSLKPFNSSSGEVVLGALLNTDSSEQLDMNVLQKDWLLFEVETNNSSLIPLKLATKGLIPDDLVKAYGCTYNDQKVCTQSEYSGRYVKSANNNLLIDLTMPSDQLNTLRGLSGAPVLNSDKQVVGIVSNIIPDKENDEVYFAPFSIQPLIQYLNNKKS